MIEIVLHLQIFVERFCDQKITITKYVIKMKCVPKEYVGISKHKEHTVKNSACSLQLNYNLMESSEMSRILIVLFE